MAIGDQVWYNEKPDNNEGTPDSWCAGTVVDTSTSNPGAASFYATYEDYSYEPYASVPAEGNVNIGYWSHLQGNCQTPAYAANASEGTGAGQYSTTLPTEAQ